MNETDNDKTSEDRSEPDAALTPEEWNMAALWYAVTLHMDKKRARQTARNLKDKKEKTNG